MCVRGIGSIQIYCVTNHQCPTTLPPHPKPLYACSRWHSHPCRWPLDHCFYQRSQLSHDSAASSTATNTSSPPVCLPCPGGLILFGLSRVPSDTTQTLLPGSPTVHTHCAIMFYQRQSRDNPTHTQQCHHVILSALVDALLQRGPI